ncbi:glycosyltransferase family 4 protein [Rhizobium grahamii]|uniref:Glycosyltransferase family 4 protein n=1 Tax=Rhizobium grahamii TaxID=1120045 RepID=A0A5Q0C521_9HYPH|nr:MULTISPECIES: glycosyltransferase family 4 protein [Rhizobium]QFY61006.1 glycosyltransferase family 4 protein [Rhizobium grahamii]QRM49844.1 glycosyltransferase family 4 protein [Rhizobium sp. BG6]
MAVAKRILVHDYSGHPFQVQLSRSLAKRGYHLRHVHSASFQTPKGDLKPGENPADKIEIVGLSLDQPFRKDSFFKRRSQEIEFGRLVAEEIRRFRPDIVVSSNAPLDTQAVIHKAAHSAGAHFIFWLQDIYSEAITRLLPKKLPLIGEAVAKRYRRLEYGLLRESDHVIAISEDFVPMLAARGVSPPISVVENWAPLAEMNLRTTGKEPKRGAGEVGAVYAGTLGYKHNPGLLLAVAKALPITLDIFSEGTAASTLQHAAAECAPNLRVHPWVPFAELPGVLSNADILIAMIEEEAGVFSVPSKVLTYFCSARPVLGSIPNGNLARRIIEREKAGLVVDPGNETAFISNMQRLAEDAGLRAALGANGLAYAERAFSIDRITDRFEGIFDNLAWKELRAI